MGLAVVHGIVMNHQGAIDIESAVGIGTTFTLYLPRLVNPEMRAEPVSHAAVWGPVTAFDRPRLLIVDDEVLLVQVLKAVLEEAGYEVTVSTRSSEALELVEAAPRQFDLVVTDQTMPEMTGDVFAQALRHLREDLPIILCTGFSDRIDATRAHELGFDAFLMKPLTGEQLVVTIDQVLERRTLGGHADGAES